MTIPNIYRTLVFLLLSVFLSATASISASGTYDWLAPTHEVSAVQLFDPFFGDNEKAHKALFEGDHRYKASLNSIALKLLKGRVEELMEKHPDRIIKGYNNSRYANFLFLERVELGVDFNFKQGSLLSRDSRIVSVSHHTSDSLQVEEPVFIHSISFQNNNYRRYLIEISDWGVNLLVMNDDLKLTSSPYNQENKNEAVWINVTDYKSAKTDLPRRGDDVMNRAKIAARYKAEFEKLLAIDRGELEMETPLWVQKLHLINEAKEMNRKFIEQTKDKSTLKNNRETIRIKGKTRTDEIKSRPTASKTSN